MEVINLDIIVETNTTPIKEDLPLFYLGMDRQGVRCEFPASDLGKYAMNHAAEQYFGLLKTDAQDPRGIVSQ